jgi:hypothetical protein
MISYNEKTDQYIISVLLGEYTLPVGVYPQFKLDTIGYFISYIEDNTVIRIHLTNSEYDRIYDDFIASNL